MSESNIFSAFDEQIVLPQLVERFKRAAIVCGYGHEDEDFVMQGAGQSAIRRTAQEFDLIGPKARVIGLVPLLDDPDPNIRIMAAACLALIMPERAIPVLEEVDQNDYGMTTRRAFVLLWFYEHGELGWINGLDKAGRPTIGD